MKNNKAKNILLLVLVLGLGGMTIAYAMLSQQLNIESTAKVKASSWDIKFANLSTASKQGATNVVTEPTLTDTLISGLNVELSKPGDSLTYTFDIVNNGDISAKIGTYTLNQINSGIVCTGTGDTATTDSELVCNNLNYSLTYTNATTTAQTGSVIEAGTALAADQELNAGKTVNVTMTISLNSDMTTLPSNDVTIDGLDAAVIYQQK